MSATDRPRSRPAGLLTETGRIEAFSDGVFAIAITLLVLDLHSPEAANHGHFTHFLLIQWPTYLAYLAAFITIGVIWINHHVLFTRINRVDPPMLWLNLLLLGSSSVLPFPTAVLARALQEGTHRDITGALLLYVLVSMLQGAAWYLLYRHLRREPHLLTTEADRDLFKQEQTRALIGIALYIILGLLAVALPRTAAIAVLVFPLFYGITSHSLTVRADANRVA